MSTKSASGRLRSPLPGLLQNRQKILGKRWCEPGRQRQDLLLLLLHKTSCGAAARKKLTRVSNFGMNSEVLSEPFLLMPRVQAMGELSWSAANNGHWKSLLACLNACPWERGAPPHLCVLPHAEVLPLSQCSDLSREEDLCQRNQQTRSVSALVENVLSKPGCPPWSFLPLPISQYTFQSTPMQDKTVF